MDFVIIKQYITAVITVIFIIIITIIINYFQLSEDLEKYGQYNSNYDAFEKANVICLTDGESYIKRICEYKIF